MKWKNVLLVLAVLVVINLPVAHELVQRLRLDSSGVAVRATVLQERDAGGQSFLAFSVPADSPRPGDPAFRGTARVDARTATAAERAGTVTVRVLPGSTTDWRVEGQVRSDAGLVLGGVADLLMLAGVALYLRFRHRLRPELVLVAEDDLSVVDGEVATLERLSEQRYVVSGTVVALASGPDGDAVVVDVEGRRIRVLLDGHANPAGPDELVSAVGTMIA